VKVLPAGKGPGPAVLAGLALFGGVVAVTQVRWQTNHAAVMAGALAVSLAALGALSRNELQAAWRLLLGRRSEATQAR